MARSQQPASLKMTFLFVFLLSLFSSLAPALQVTPNSPCAQFCLDSSDHDSSNHKSSSTHGDDIVCNDDEFASRSEGQKFQRCLSCLQDSTFKNGDENDQDWFLYNLRYSFDYCVFGYPNATGIGSSPCITSEACGPLEKALKKGITEPDDRKQYDYCDVDGKAMLGNSYGNCQACITVDSTRTIISNFLVALEAGCQQRPKPGATISLNDTVFSESSVGIADPSASLAPEDSHALPNSSIAGIAVGGFVFLLISMGCIFVQHRKRKNRSALNRPSSWSFRCQTHLTPRQPDFGPLDRDYFGRPYMDEENSPIQPTQLNSHPRSAMSGLRTSHKLDTLCTSIPHPPAAHTTTHQSPAEDVSPTSSISSCSTTAPLLFNAPLGHQVASPGISSPLFSPGFSVASPRTPRTPRSGTFPPREQSDSNNPWLQERASGSGKGFFKKRDTRSFQAPTETRNIKIVFDPPPKRAR
ncbi:exo-alpha-sialidase neuraminidase [Fusarium albosuccineum]|uniref:Exo-alpha-sialidase neuraminidase n=1 Tax=Fusarium albosuccineum TaxID=1237068 RepID=A0A8H4LI63_9HYPO|nr:exo-alpha-sialidase neuraminidase [Fusarium albosuccineum]